MKINTIHLYPKTQQQNNTKENIKTPVITSHNKVYDSLVPQYNDHLIAFGARVDKGLERFYEANQERMPETVKNYIETLEDKSKISPLEAQQKAFEYLRIADTPEDIKGAFSSPEEPLFKNLINPEDSKARRGIIKTYNDFAPLMAEDGKTVLQNGENLTVYLVKKIFLENKTLDEINKDLDIDLDPDFKGVFYFNNKDAKFIYPATLSSLGIQTPQREYLQSLRYTKEGYSDIVGQKISEGQRAFYNSLPDEERTARARKSVANFENWWTSMSKNQQLEILAEQDAELKMLKMFKSTQRKNKKTSTAQSDTPEVTKVKTDAKKGVKVGSSKLSQDELFIKWATNNLKIFNESLSEAEKDSLHVKRMRNMTNRWKEMSAIERTEYISKMKSGSEPLRFAMIDAWNNSTDIIKDLSLHLRNNQIYKPADLLYSTQEFSVLQSQIMTEFWEKHPEHAEMLGERIHSSHEKIKDSISNGHFEELKRQIMRNKNQRIKEIDTFKKVTPQTITQATDEPDYIKNFKQAYFAQPAARANLKNMPQTYINDYFTVISEGFDRETIEIWTKHLKNEPITKEEQSILVKIANTEPAGAARINRAMEATLANILYDCTQNPDVFRFSHSDAKTAIAQIDRGETEIGITSLKEKETFRMPILKHKIDKAKIASLYQSYKETLNPIEVYRIATSFFNTVDSETEEKLASYINSFGKSANIIFSERSTFPREVKERFYKKFADNMPDDLVNKIFCFFDNSTDPFGREANIKRANFLFAKRFDFIPSLIMENYQDELGRSFRHSSIETNFEEFIRRGCTKRADAKANAGLCIAPKSNFKIINKLRTLAAEQVLAEALYDSTKNPEVFSLQFEELCDNIECFNLCKKFPVDDTRIFNSYSFGNEIKLNAQTRINLSHIKDEYIACLNEVIDTWLNTEVKNTGEGTLKTLVECLAGGEDNTQIIENMVKRISIYNLKLKLR